MTTVEIVLLVVGFIFVCLSFFLSRRTDGGGALYGEGTTQTVWTELEEKMIRDRVDEILRDYQTELVDDTENQMNRLCNEKIMAIDEFSQQILSKMDANHQEVVFMYNMLNEKQQEIAKVVTASSVSPSASNSKKGSKRPAEKAMSDNDKKLSLKDNDETKEDNKKGMERDIDKDIASSSKKSSGKKRQNRKNSQAGSSSAKKYDKSDFRESSTSENDWDGNNETASMNRETNGKNPGVNLSEEVQEKIQKMHREGKSVLEISRELKVGQGEVKLIIALYGGRRR